MHVGAFMLANDQSVHPAQLARTLEDHGLESLWVAEHTHIPVSRETPYPGGGDLPDLYARTLDPFLALTVAAAVTTKLKLGTGVSLVVERDPIVTAKEVSTLDWLSDGRFLFGVGGGWNREEMRNHGTDPARRWALMRERILAMKEIWTHDAAEFHGQYVDFDPIWQWPKPIQRPHPPILVGGDGATTFDRVVEYGDGWVPIVWRSKVPFAARVHELWRRCEEAGRPRLPVSAFYMGRTSDEDLEEKQRLGLERVILPLPLSDSDRLRRRIELYASLAERLPP